MSVDARVVHAGGSKSARLAFALQHRPPLSGALVVSSRLSAGNNRWIDPRRGLPILASRSKSPRDKISASAAKPHSASAMLAGTLAPHCQNEIR